MDRRIAARRAVDTYSDTLLRLCMTYLRNPHDAEDITQEVLLKLLTHGPFDSPEHEKAWVLRVAINACRDVLRSAAHRLRADTQPADALLADALPATGSSPYARAYGGPYPEPGASADSGSYGESYPEPGASAGPVTEAVAQLPHAQRLAVYLYYYEGYDAAEIAELTGASRDAVYQHLHRARRALKNTLTQNGARP
ncbi:RNA polymerase sigma factor [Corynebacterium lizhenjunii]|uniref:RNA polymerase sigma factor n=1 Tax=Corynebacterium lizhenjunii TaxID=2709394 RepID=UPI0013EC4D9C|nr:sigma-70 family RNA polymerase sigma factor [Corynebacterium lizhenjunii]